MYSGFNNHVDFDQRPTQFHHCEYCHAAVRAPCCHVIVSNSNHVNHVNRRNSVNDPQNRSNCRFVEVTKAKGEPLGLTLRASVSGRCIIARIMHGGLIHKTGLLHVKDEILEINGNPITGHSIESIQQYLLSKDGTIVLKIAPSPKGQKSTYQMHVRAMFAYDPREDPELPCPELGQSFKVGDILEIVDATDFTWWQARTYNGESSPAPAGLIPSADLEESRLVRASKETFSSLMVEYTNPTNHFASLLNLLSARRFPRSSTSTSSTTGSGFIDSLSENFSHWMLFRRHSSSRKRHRSASRRRGDGQGILKWTSARRSHSTETFSLGQDDDKANHFDAEDMNNGGGQNGYFLEENLSFASTTPSRTCSRCNSIVQTTTSNSTTTTTTSAGVPRRPPRWKECASFLFSEVAFSAYEEVTKVRDFRHRSLVILGAHGVGRRALRKALIRARPDLFAQVIPHTTRKPEPNERNGEHYFFVQEEEMAADIVNREFLEYGQRKNILYGTRLDSIRSVMTTGRLPVLDVEPRALRILRSAEFAPLIVLLVPPPLNRLLSQDCQRENLDESLRKLDRESEVLEYIYRPYVDALIVHRGIEESVDEIVDLVREARCERWIPIRWTC